MNDARITHLYSDTRPQRHASITAVTGIIHARATMSASPNEATDQLVHEAAEFLLKTPGVPISDKWQARLVINALDRKDDGGGDAA